LFLCSNFDDLEEESAVVELMWFVSSLIETCFYSSDSTWFDVYDIMSLNEMTFLSMIVDSPYSLKD